MQTDRPTLTRSLLLVVVAVVGLNLRPFLTAIGPLASTISRETGLNYQSMALLTLVPILLMGICAFTGPFLQRVMGSRRVVIASLVILCLGSALRLFTAHGGALLATAAMCGLGVAIIQAVFPSIIKQQFPKQVTIVMGLYSSMLMGGGALGAQVSPMITGASGSWHAGLAWVALPAALAVVMAAWLLPCDQTPPFSGPLRTAALLRRPRTWLLMACFGLVNGGYSSVVAWLAPFYQTKGWTNASSGSLLAMMATSQAIAALLLPILATRDQDRRLWLWFALSMQLIGFAGFGLWPTLSPATWAILVGVGLGGCFALSMVVALDHLQDATQAGALSALMQGGGFLIAALPPWIVAALHDLTGSFAAGWLFHFCCAGVVAILALRFKPDGYARAMSIPTDEQSRHLLPDRCALIADKQA